MRTKATHCWRHWTGLPPASHSAVHKLRVARKHNVWPKAELLGHARAEALDKPVGSLAQA